MADACTRGLVRLHDQALRPRDEAGSTLLAYALGAAPVIVPLAAVLFLFGGDTATEASDLVDGVIAKS